MASCSWKKWIRWATDKIPKGSSTSLDKQPVVSRNGIENSWNTVNVIISNCLKKSLFCRLVTPIRGNNSEILNPSVNCNLIDSRHECLRDTSEISPSFWPRRLYVNEKILEEEGKCRGVPRGSSRPTHRPCSPLSSPLSLSHRLALSSGFLAALFSVVRGGGSTIVIGDYVNQTPRYTPLQFA